jgi:tight adherence protein B
LFADLARRAELGEHLAPHWTAAAQTRASPALRTVAIGWRLSERHGASLVGVLEPLLSAVRADVRARAAVEAALAGPRASATLLGVLPVVGLLLGEAIGVHPIPVLLGTPVGRVALVAGAVATGVGHAWMRALVRRAEP